MSLISRRGFLKCVGLSSLAVASAVAFGGCSPDDVPNVPGVTPGSGSSGNTSGIYRPVTSPALTLAQKSDESYHSTAFSDYTFSFFSAYTITGPSDLPANKVLVRLTFSIQNNSSSDIKLETSSGDPYKFVPNSDGSDNAHCAVAKAGNEVLPTKIYSNNTSSASDPTLKPSDIGSSQLYVLAPAGWSTIDVTYTPSFTSCKPIQMRVTPADCIQNPGT